MFHKKNNAKVCPIRGVLAISRKSKHSFFSQEATEDKIQLFYNDYKEFWNGLKKNVMIKKIREIF